MTQREQFEQWAKSCMLILHHRLGRKPPNFALESGYINATTDVAWRAWQAAQAEQQAKIDELEAKLAKCREFMEVVISPNCVDNYFYLYLAAKEACGL